MRIASYSVLSVLMGRAGLVALSLLALASSGESCHAPGASTPSAGKDAAPSFSSGKEAPSVTYYVAPELRATLVPFADPASPRDPASDFAAVRQESDRFCEMVWGKTRFDRSRSVGFVSAAAYERGPFRTMDHPLPKLIAGCWNFFQMNDTRPDLDMRLVRSLYPSEKKDCFSVGLVQPYLMHSILDCQSLTMIDIDWRILDAHRQITGLLAGGEMRSEETTRRALQGLQLGWSARFDGRPMEAVSPASLEALCFASDRSMCLEALLGVQRTFSHLRRIRLEISALHDGDYSRWGDGLAVIFLSNAIEDLYTSRQQFDRMLQRVQESLQPGQKAVFVHHAAGRSQFGLYEMQRTEAGSEIRTICRDIYLSSPVGKVYPYVTHFERVSVTRQPRACSGWDPAVVAK